LNTTNVVAIRLIVVVRVARGKIDVPRIRRIILGTGPEIARTDLSSLCRFSNRMI